MRYPGLVAIQMIVCELSLFISMTEDEPVMTDVLKKQKVN